MLETSDHVRIKVELKRLFVSPIPVLSVDCHAALINRNGSEKAELEINVGIMENPFEEIGSRILIGVERLFER